MSESKSALRRFFEFIWGAVITLYRVLIVLSLIVFIGFAWFTLRGGPRPTVEDNIALVVWPSGDLVDQVDVELRLFERFTREPPSQTLLRDLVEAIDAAAADSRISSIVLKLDNLWSGGMPQMQELAAALQRFKATGKPVHAQSPYYDQTGYLAAAAADDVSVDPQGTVYLEGFGVYQNYFKDALDKLGVRMNVFRVGEFKAAVEPFIRNDMSEEARLANAEWLGDLWTEYGNAVGTARKLEAGAVSRYVQNYRVGVENLRGNSAVYAKEAGLVTHIETLEQFRQRMATDVGLDPEHGSFRQIHHSEYLRAARHDQKRKKSARRAASDIALVVVQGEIVDGLGERGQAGGDTVSELLEDARRDEEVAAVVLRIDSPGGSVWASEQIRRQVLALKAAGKPVVASMGSVAASGGYWVAMDADQIWAHPTTITGSIGIFGLVPTIDEPMAKLGISTDGVGTTSLAGAFRIDRPLSDEVKAIFQTEIERGYREFIDGVAAGRKLDPAKVESIAQGRVWSGDDAKGFGLIDAFGGLEPAAAAAAELAGLGEGEWALTPFEPAPTFAGGLLGEFFGSLKLDLGQVLGLPPATHPLMRALEQADAGNWLRRFNDPRGAYAHCMCAPDRAPRMP
ncbi:signal peptide peptidase SppA [Panacagrimonas sp.]|uniref:signal peptide peptidase SppA n=1 Tax=Panacagrimonas sp. TaxID=2480088 RepID=UPI003B51F200